MRGQQRLLQLRVRRFPVRVTPPCPPRTARLALGRRRARARGRLPSADARPPRAREPKRQRRCGSGPSTATPTCSSLQRWAVDRPGRSGRRAPARRRRGALIRHRKRRAGRASPPSSSAPPGLDLAALDPVARPSSAPSRSTLEIDQPRYLMLLGDPERGLARAAARARPRRVRRPRRARPPRRLRRLRRQGRSAGRRPSASSRACSPTPSRTGPRRPAPATATSSSRAPRRPSATASPASSSCPRPSPSATTRRAPTTCSPPPPPTRATSCCRCRTASAPRARLEVPRAAAPPPGRAVPRPRQRAADRRDDRRAPVPARRRVDDGRVLRRRHPQDQRLPAVARRARVRRRRPSAAPRPCAACPPATRRSSPRCRRPRSPTRTARSR
jgi:hypothetical protein